MKPKPISYLDFEVRIEKQGDQYRAHVVGSPAGKASAMFTLPFFDEMGKLKLENLLLRLGARLGSTRKIYTEEMDAARELGSKLFSAMFSGDTLTCLRKSLDEVYCREATGLRLRLRFPGVPELAELPWEYLFDASENRFLAQSHLTPVVRYAEMPPIQPLNMKLPLNILVAISSPADYRHLDTEQEKELLREALGNLGQKNRVRIRWLENVSYKSLQQTLRRGTYHVFHFIGHGGFDFKEKDEGGLILEDRKGNGIWTGADRIGTLLHDHKSLRLAVLNACEGAKISQNDPFSGVATTLIRQGIPAVVAMQFEISDEAAITFADEFYTALTDGFPADAAVAEARKAVYGISDVEWGTPVLYMRCADGVLFRVGQVADGEVDKGITVTLEEDESAEIEVVSSDTLEENESSEIEVVSSDSEETTEPLQEERFTNSLGMEFVYIRPGTFMMGSPEDEPGRFDNETLHQVTLTKGFYMQTTPVTQKQWEELMGSNPSHFKNCSDCPVERVSWDDVQKFIKKLNKTENTDKYRLPSEAEWEYACRAETTTPFFFGRCLSTDEANHDGNYPLEGCSKGKYREKTTPVGSFPANAWGLYDMHGNVYEWVADIYGDSIYTASQTDPIYIGIGSYRVIRGGDWSDYARYCRSADRSNDSPGSRRRHIGFRLIRNL